MTLEEFKKEINDFVKNEKPEYWRNGQAVFNYIDQVYGVARKVQFDDRIDCFYNDDKINEFIEASFKYIK